jgi:hypothetical protein
MCPYAYLTMSEWSKKGDVNARGTCGCRKSMPTGDIHESRLLRGRAAGAGSCPGR